MNEEIYDVILQATGTYHPDIDTFQAHRPPSDDFYLTDEMWVGRLPHRVSPTFVFDACESRGWQHNPSRMYGMRYALCRKVTETRETYGRWDHDHAIGSAIQFSRFIRPTTIGSCLTARLYFKDSELTTILPGPTQSKCSHAYVIAEGTYRDWLSVPEWQQLRDLLPRYIGTTAPRRVRLARRHISDAFYAFYLDERFASLVTAFESLLKTSRNDLTQQFKLRASRLAEMLGLELSAEDLRHLYAHRSDFVHGAVPNFEGLDLDADGQDSDSSQIHPALLDRYNKCERVLRLALLRASTEPEFAAHFASDEAVERNFGSKPPKLTQEQKCLEALKSATDEEFEAEYTRRYGAALPLKGLQEGAALDGQGLD